MSVSAASKSERLTVRFNVASLILGTTVLSFVMYATMKPSLWAASLGFTFVFALLCFTLVAALASRGPTRQQGLAFSLSGLAYLMLMYGPYVDQRVGARLIHTLGFAAFEESLLDDPVSDKRVSEQRGWAAEWLAIEWAGQMFDRREDASKMLPQETWAGRVFHSACALLCAFVGGWVATGVRQSD